MISYQEKHDLIDISTLNSSIVVDIKYATTDNFVHQAVYTQAKAYQRSNVANKLDRVQKMLEKRGLGLKIWDAYRPLSVQRIFWSLMPDERFVADPEMGSSHNRGAAVDVTLVDASGKELAMPTGFDDFTEKAHHNSLDHDSVVIKNRELLKSVMLEQGFEAHPNEWWHYNDADAQSYPVLDISFEELGS